MPRRISTGRVTVKDVAAEAGVSPMTVSNAYNRPDQLSAGLRARVLETAARMGYAGPSRAARDLRLGAQRTLGVVYDTPLSYAVRDAAASAFLGGVAAVAGPSEHHLLLLATADPVAATRGADALVVYSVADADPVLAAALDRHVPLVVVDQPRVRGVPAVRADDRAGARHAAAHLTGLGHRRVAVLAFGHGDGTPSPLGDVARRAGLPYAVTRERLAGYDEALRKAGVDPAAVAVHEAPGPDAEAARTAARAMLQAVPRPTAVLAMSDDLALAVLDAASELGIAVPRDLSVTGFDDVPAAARAALTTVHQDHDRKGRLAAELLLARLAGEPTGAPARLRTRLVVRGTTAPPPRAEVGHAGLEPATPRL